MNIHKYPSISTNINKYLLISLFILIGIFFFSNHTLAATEFTATVMQTGGDYSTLSSWENAINCDLTVTSTLVFSHGGITGTIADGSTVTGAVSGATGAAKHVTATQILITGITGTFQSGEQVYQTLNVNYVTISNAGDSAIAVAKIDGAWTAADTTAVTIDGWTTSATNYIKIYTTAAARHDGKWNDNKYRLEVAVPQDGQAIKILEEYVRIEGLQVYNTGSGDWGSAIGASYIASGTGEHQFSYNIVKGGTSPVNGNFGIITSNSADIVSKIWNNIVYNVSPSAYMAGIFTQGGTSYLYNNTIYNCFDGIWAYTGTIIAINNIAYNNTHYDFEGSFTSSDYNFSKDDTAPGTHSIHGTTQSKFPVFVNTGAGTEDFHLQITSDARDVGLSQYSDANCPVTTDIDGQHRRPNGEVTDIGADEDIDTLDGVSVRISNIQQSGTRYTTLSGWEAGRNGDITGYYPEVAQIDGSWSSPDTTPVTIDGWVTDATHYIKIYTTTAARHSGVWDDTKYRMSITAGWDNGITISEDYVRIDGLQIHMERWYACIRTQPSGTNTDIRISNNILQATGFVSADTVAGVSVGGADDNVGQKIYNNIIYDMNPGVGTGWGIYLSGAYQTGYIYNNTFYNCDYGIYNSFHNAFTLKNNIAQNCNKGYQDYNSEGWGSGSDYNLSDLSNDAPGSNSRNLTTVTFVDPTGSPPDFHLALTDLGARGYGLSQYSDANCPVTTDIDGQHRMPNGEVTDIGADEDIDTLDGESVRISNIQQSGTRYTTLSAWEDDRDGDITGYYPEVAQIDGNWSAADTDGVWIDGWTTSAANYIKIYTTTAARHGGVWNDAKYRLVVSTDGYPIATNNDAQHIWIDGLQISAPDVTWRSAVRFQNLLTNSPVARVSNCIIKGAAGTALGRWGISSADGILLKAWNNIIYDFAGTSEGGIGFRHDTSDCLIYNNTIVNCTIGLSSGGWADGRVINNLVKGGTTAFDFYVAYAHNNATDNATGPNGVDLGDNRTSQIFTFVNESGDDFHLASNDAGARNYGTNLAGDGSLAFNTDIDGNQRPSEANKWDIGADENAEAIIQFMRNVNFGRNINFKP